MNCHRFLQVAGPLFAVALTGCGGATPNPPPAAAQAPSNRAPEKPPQPRAPALDAGKVDDIENEQVRAAYDAWRAARSEALGKQEIIVSHRVEEVSRCMNCEDLVLTERRASEHQCLQGPVIYNAYFDDASKLVTSAREVGFDCCPGTECQITTPASWTLRLYRLVAEENLTAMAELIDPDGGLSARSGYHGAEESGEETFTFHRSSLNASLWSFISTPNWLYFELACPAAFSATEPIECRVFAGGYVAELIWSWDGQKAYLISFDEESH